MFERQKSFFFVHAPAYKTDRVLADVRAVAEIPAPTFEEDARIDWLEKRLAESAVRPTRDEVGNLVWRWGRGRPRLMLTAHVDTVFPRETKLSTNVDGDRLHGPGVGDNAAAIAVVLNVAESIDFQRAAYLAAGAVVFTVGEEGLGNLRGALAALETLKPEAMIAVEGHGLESIAVDAIGSVRSQIRIDGPGGHSWVDRGTPSAIHEGVRIGAQLLAKSSHDSPVNLGTLSGGVSVNTIASSAEIDVELRSADSSRLDSFETILASLPSASSLAVSVVEIARRPAGELDRDHPLVNVVNRARRELDLPEAYVSASTDANAAFAFGIPALSIGVANGRSMHSVEEEISISSLEIGRRQLEKILTYILDSKSSYHDRGWLS